MSKRTLFSVDPLTGYKTYWESHGDGTFSVITETDVAPLLEQNKRKQAMGREYYAGGDRKGEPSMWKVASIPLIFEQLFRQKYGVDIYSKDPDQQRKLRQLLNSSDYRFLKTADITL